MGRDDDVSPSGIRITTQLVGDLCGDGRVLETIHFSNNEVLNSFSPRPPILVGGEKVEPRLVWKVNHVWPTFVEDSRTAMSESIKDGSFIPRFDLEFETRFHGFEKGSRVQHLIIVINSLKCEKRVHEKAIPQARQVLLNSLGCLLHIAQPEPGELDGMVGVRDGCLESFNIGDELKVLRVVLVNPGSLWNGIFCVVASLTPSI